MQQIYVPLRIKRNCFLKGLMPPSDSTDAIEQSNQAKLKEVHVLPNSFQVPALLTTWNDNLGFYSQEKGTVICVTINDRLITQMFNQMFDLLFDQLPNSGGDKPTRTWPLS